MPCYRPLKAYKKAGGGVAFDGVKGYRDRPVDLPCGACVGCRMARARQWAIRCVHEAQMHDRNCFVTLTYSDEHLPADRSVDVREWQLFAKKLRKKVGKFRYFHCGEYGDVGLRPHYHALIFGVDFHFDRQPIGKGLFASPLLEETWGKGFAPIGEVTMRSAAYVARYCIKKQVRDSDRYDRIDPETGETWKVKPEYVTMSRGGSKKGSGGIGSSWFEKFKDDVYPHDNVVIGGQFYRPPRFYDERLPESELDQVKRSRSEFIRSREDVSLEAAEKVAEAKLNLYRREL